jgi:predicted phage tail component-like protein
MNYLIWRGQDSRYIKGLVISELPPITKPNMRVQETVIDGVDGSIIEELGYESYDKAIFIGLTQNADINEILEYFTGDGEVVFSNEKDKYYKAKIIGQIDYARLVRFKTATVVFRVQPFKYDYLEETAILQIGETQLTVENIGNYFSKPIIEIRGSGMVELAVNGNKLFRYTFPDTDDTVVIDSQKQDAYLGANLKNRNMSGEFPILEVGTNTITWEGDILSLSISSKSRWL